jgi:hypothetical protein
MSSKYKLVDKLLRKIPGVQRLRGKIRSRLERLVDNRLNQHFDEHRLEQLVDNRLNQRFGECRLEQLVDNRLTDYLDPTVFRMAKGWASSLQPGTVSPHALFGSSLCRMEDLEHPRYHRLCRQALDREPILHRKQWEFIYIIEKLRLNNCLREGAKGLGFGVGTEPLASYFVSQGCTILATDAPDYVVDQGWKQTAQHATQIENIWYPRLVDEQLFKDRCSFLPLNMNIYADIPEGFDFHWSSCVIEHLGGIRQAIDFLLESVQRLAPGGVAVHTTEFNLSSDVDTIDQPGTCILRGSDVNQLVTTIEERGFEMDPVILDPGQHPYNFHVDVPPYRSAVHLRLQLENFASTSLGLIIRKPANN